MKHTILGLTLIILIVSCKREKTKEKINNKQKIEIMELSNKDKAQAFIKSFETGSSKILNFIDENIKSHNYGLPDGKSTYEGYFTDEPSGATVGNVRVFEDNEFVIMHNHYENLEGYPERVVTFDIVRLKDGKIIEHWDNVTEVQPQNPSGHTQTDGTTEVKDLDKTEANKALVSDFVNTVLVKAQYNKMDNYFDGDNYIQHNSSIGDGLSGLSKALEAMAKQGVSMVYNTNHKVLGQGNFVLTISEGTFAGKETSFYDLFRVENDKIAEHWDIMETIAKKDDWQNQNGKFNF